METKPRARPSKAQLEGLSLENQKALKQKFRREYQIWWREDRHKNPQLEALDKAMDLVRYRKKMRDPEGYQKIQDARYKAENKRRGTRVESPRKPDNTRINHLKYNFGITPEEYNKLLSDQGYVCAICGKEEKYMGTNNKIMNLSIDHDHETGNIRGLLCNSCNRGLGFFQDSKDILGEAIKYLK